MKPDHLFCLWLIWFLKVGVLCRRITVNVTFTSTANVYFNQQGWAAQNGKVLITLDLNPGPYVLAMVSKDTQTTLVFSASIAIDQVWAAHSQASVLWRELEARWDYTNEIQSPSYIEAPNFGDWWYIETEVPCGSLPPATASFDGNIVQSKW